jgi:hypothetical protein
MLRWPRPGEGEGVAGEVRSHFQKGVILLQADQNSLLCITPLQRDWGMALMRMKKLGQGVVLAGVLVLGACGPSGGTGNGAANAVAANSPSVTVKVSAYTEAYNALIDDNGLPETVEAYKKANIAHRSPGEDISIDQGWIANAESKLKAAHALPGDMGALDAAAGKLDDALNKVLARLEPLYTYYNAKSYRQDGLARGKSENTQMIAELDAAVAAMNDFHAALQHQRRAGVESELAALKQSGNILGYNNKLAMQHAEDLVGLFTKSADLRDPAALGKADTLAASIEKLVPEQQKLVAEARAKAPAPIEKSRAEMYGLVADELGRLIGHYRQMKLSRSGNDLQSLVDSYNRAVSTGNNII